VVITTTLNAIVRQHPSPASMQKLLEYLNKTEPDDEPLPLAVIAASNGLDEALWCLRMCDVDNVARVTLHNEMRKFAAGCCRLLLDAVPSAAVFLPPAIKAAEDYADGLIDDAALSSANLQASSENLDALAISDGQLAAIIAGAARQITLPNFDGFNMSRVVLLLDMLHRAHRAASKTLILPPLVAAATAALPANTMNLFIQHFCSDNN
jgi:hypothetical protein